jgi:LysM repeat protein
MTAVSLDPEFSQAHRALGQVYSKKGLFDEAVRHFDRASGLDPANEDLKEEKKKAQAASQNSLKIRNRSKKMIWLIGVAGFLIGLAVFPLFRLVAKKPEAPPSREVLASRIKAGLAGNPSLADCILEIEQTQVGLSVSGEVPSNLHKNLVFEIARNTAGAMPVDCEGLRIVPPRLEPEKRQNLFVYTVKAGDSLGGIARKFYGREMMWQRIYEANKDKLSSAHAISPGQVLAIPLENGQIVTTPVRKKS